MSQRSFLSETEEHLLKLLQRGAKSREIAKIKGEHPETTRARIVHLRGRMGACTIAELLERAKLPVEILEREFKDRTRPKPLPPEQVEAKFRLDFESRLHFYRYLGPERSGTSCKREGCGNGAIRHSVLCREHHYEQVRRESCPFHGDA